MRIIKHLSKQIEDEIHGVCEYAKDALEYRYTRPQLAETYYKLANVEYTHVTALHEQAVRIVEDTKKEKREIPAFMLEKWEKKHRCIIDKMAEAKIYLGMYK